MIWGFLFCFFGKLHCNRAAGQELVIKRISFSCGDYRHQRHNPLTQPNDMNQVQEPGQVCVNHIIPGDTLTKPKGINRSRIQTDFDF